MENVPFKEDNQNAKKISATKKVRSSSSLKQDFFVVGFGILIVVLIFFSYRAIAGLDLEVVIPRECKKVVDMYGRAIISPDNEISSQAAARYFWIAMIMGCAAIAAFFFSFVIVKWIKNNKKLAFKPKPFDRSQNKNPPSEA